jgi:hypothetical protein
MATKTPTLVRTNINLGLQQHSELVELANLTGLFLSEHIRRTIDDYIKRQKRQQGNAGGGEKNAGK